MEDNVVYKVKGLEITDSEVRIGKATYPRSEIRWVGAHEAPLPGGQRAVGIVLGLALLILVALMSNENAMCGAPLALLGLTFVFGAIFSKSYSLDLGLREGSVMVPVANKKSLETIVTALEKHVIAANAGDTAIAA